MEIQKQAVDLDEKMFGVAAPAVGPWQRQLNELGGVKPLPPLDLAHRRRSSLLFAGQTISRILSSSAATPATFAFLGGILFA
jgi:hypothetical protein